MLPTNILYADSDHPNEKGLFTSLYDIFYLSDYDALVYPKGFDIEDESIPVWIIVHEQMMGEEVTFVLQTHLNPKTETLLTDSDYDTLRIYSNRNDAYSYVERISSIILESR